MGISAIARDISQRKRMEQVLRESEIRYRSLFDDVPLCEQRPEPIHLLVTDVIMPHMSGPELAERLARCIQK